MDDDPFRFNDPFAVIDTTNTTFPELVGKWGRVIGRYLQTGSWEVIIGGKKYVLPQSNMVRLTYNGPESRQIPLLKVTQDGEDNAPQFFRTGNLIIAVKDGNLIIEGKTYVPADKVIKVAEKYGRRRHDWWDVIETEVYPELGIVPPPPRMVTFKVTVPEAVLLEDVDSDTQDYTRWDQVALLAELAGTITLLDERRQLDQAEIEIVSAGNDGPEN